MKIAVIQFPGSNCERETTLAVKRNGMEALPFIWNEDPSKLKECDGYIIVGGFSYEDRGRAGVIAALDPVMQHIAKEAALGKPVLGICNGAQILVESGLVPGVKSNRLAMALAANKRIKDGHILGTGYYNDYRHIAIAKSYPKNAFLKNLAPNKALRIPVAHGEGRFVLAEKLWEKILAENIGFLQYCDEAGTIKDGFPTNPNGSEHNLAALCNLTGNVMAIMPHPERVPEGDVIFSSMRDYIKSGCFTPTTAIDFTPEEVKLTPYSLPANSHEEIIKLIINDNTALSIQQALHNLQFGDVRIERYTHWEITFAKPEQEGELLHQIKAINESYELFNPNKESVSKNLAITNNSFAILVQDKENIVGQHKLAVLRETFKINGISSVKHGNIWIVIAESADSLTKAQKFIFEKHVLFNPFSQNGFWYKNSKV